MSGLVLPAVGVKPVRYKDLILGTSGLVSAWPLDELSGTNADDKKSTNDGTYTGGVTLDQSGIIYGYNAASFDGIDNFVDLGNPAGLSGIGNAWSLEAWVFATAAPQGSGVISETYESTVRFELGFSLTVNDGTSAPSIATYSGGWNYLQEGSNVPLDVWHHLVGTYDGTNMRLYRNGALTAGPGALAATPGDSSGYTIGRRHDTGGTKSYFPGRIAWPAIYNRALTADEVRMHYVVGLQRRKLGLAA